MEEMGQEALLTQRKEGARQERCRVCDVPISSCELCEACAVGNDPFPPTSKLRGRP